MMTATEQLALLREVAEIERPFLSSPDWSPQDTHLIMGSEVQCKCWYCTGKECFINFREDGSAHTTRDLNCRLVARYHSFTPAPHEGAD